MGPASLKVALQKVTAVSGGSWKEGGCRRFLPNLAAGAKISPRRAITGCLKGRLPSNHGWPPWNPPHPHSVLWEHAHPGPGDPPGAGPKTFR